MKYIDKHCGFNFFTFINFKCLTKKSQSTEPYITVRDRKQFNRGRVLIKIAQYWLRPATSVAVLSTDKGTEEQYAHITLF